MASYVALLRGVNVGGVRLAMADLRSAVADCGHTDVVTYVQSGNVVLTASGRRSPVRLAAEIRAAIAARAGIEPRVVVLRATEWDDLVDGNPYPHVTDGTRLHAVVAQEPFTDAQRRAALEIAEHVREGGSRDELTIRGRVAYLHLPDGMGRSVLAEKLGRSRASGHQDATARNWRTVLALQEMLHR